MLADMHIAGQSYPGALENPRGPRWWREAAREVLPFLEAPHARLLESELEFQSRFRGHELRARRRCTPTSSATTCSSRTRGSAA